MRELSLHVLDLIENATRAGASVVCVRVIADPKTDRLEIAVEDNGPGLPIAAEQALDPFYTTKEGKQTGLGLSLFEAAAERAGGSLAVEHSALGGVAVKAAMHFGHVDRAPLGDLAGTIFTAVLGNPDVDFWCCITLSGQKTVLRCSEVARELAHGGGSLAVARHLAERVRQALAGAQ